MEASYRKRLKGSADVCLKKSGQRIFKAAETVQAYIPEVKAGESIEFWGVQIVMVEVGEEIKGLMNAVVI